MDAKRHSSQINDEVEEVHITWERNQEKHLSRLLNR